MGNGVFEMLYEPGPVASPEAGSADSSMRKLLRHLWFPKALYIMGADPAVTFPDTSRIVSGLRALDLLIVQDIALTETAKLAHVVLPAASWAERDGTFTNAEGVAQQIRKIVDPPGLSLPDWQIVRDLAMTMGKDMGIEKREDILKELHMLPIAPYDAYPMVRAFNDAHYEPGEEPDGDYPLHLVVRDMLQHAGSMSTRSGILDLVAPEARLEINRKDAERLGIHDNNHVKVTSRRGAAYLKAEISDEVPDGTVYVSAHFPHGGVHTLTHPSGNGDIPVDAVKVEAA
jgi:predicted molibdopterin-dependent oxidoreductase YjgC